MGLILVGGLLARKNHKENKYFLGVYVAPIGLGIPNRSKLNGGRSL